ncbi:hypothetical protein Leryth_005533, partial [Lithospermum erythrorhizon]
MEESKNNDAAALNSDQVTEKESSVVVKGDVVEKPSGESSLQEKDAGTSHLIPVRKQIRRKKLVKKVIKDGLQNVEKVSPSNKGNKAEGQRKDNQSMELIEESKSNDSATLTSEQVTEKESSGLVNGDAVVVEEPSGESSMPAKDAGTTQPVQLRKQNQKRKLVRGKIEIKGGQKNAETASPSDEEDKAESQRKDNQSME